jgi:hypothetical protein
VVRTTAVPQPHVDALADVGSTMFAGGRFDNVTQGGKTYPRANLMAFDKTSGKLSSTFDAAIAGGQVWAMAADPSTNSIYVGGDFKTVNGEARPVLAKLNATTGQLDTAFKPLGGGRVNDLEISHVGGAKRLIVGGMLGKRLFTVNLVTGKDDGYFTSVFSDVIPDAWPYQPAIFSFSVSPDRTRLVATGNFTKVNGVARRGFVMMTLPSTTTPAPSVNSWYYPGFSKECKATADNDAWRKAYLRGIDWSPDGRYFSVAATGRISFPADIWYNRPNYVNKANTTVCDAVGRFSVADPTKPVWINYTGGDSVWTVADTGAAVYAAGHFKWLDNPDGYGSLGIGDKALGTAPTYRRALAAINPVSGRANAWDPGLSDTRTGGKALLPDGNGLWVGNDATKFNGEAHYGLAYVPLP